MIQKTTNNGQQINSKRIFAFQNLKIMWQRAQTVYLFLIVIISLLSLVFPFAYYEMGNENITFNIFGVSQNSLKFDTWFPYYISIGLTAGLALFSVTQFKNRKRQLSLGKINYAVILATVIMLNIDLTSIATGLNIPSEQINFNLIGFMLPITCLPFNFLANRGIKKDEALIKSVDRLR